MQISVTVLDLEKRNVRIMKGQEGATLVWRFAALSPVIAAFVNR